MTFSTILATDSEFLTILIVKTCTSITATLKQCPTSFFDKNNMNFQVLQECVCF